jgi:hypothetical protein
MEQFAPDELPHLLEEEGGNLRVVYAGEALQEASGRRCKGSCHNGLKRLLEELGPEQPVKELMRQLTAAKLAAMRREAEAFYSRYEGQTWKNVMSIGDMQYEHDAVQELAAVSEAAQCEKFRTKALTLPGGPSLGELTLRLQLLQLLVPALVRHDGDIDLDLSADEDPLSTFSMALGMPQLATVALPLCAWNSTTSADCKGSQCDSREVVEQALDDVAVTVHDWLVQPPRWEQDARTATWNGEQI